MKLSKKSKEPHTAEGLYNHYWNHAYNLEAYACTSSAIADFEESGLNQYEFSVWMKRQRALGDKSKEYVRRLIEVGQKRGVDLSYAPEAPSNDYDVEYIWFTTNYALKKWVKYKQAYHFSTPIVDAMRRTTKDKLMADVLNTLPYRSFYIDLENANEHLIGEDGKFQKQNIIGCFVHIDKAEGHGDYLSAWLAYLVFLAEDYNIYCMKNVYPSYEDGRAYKYDEILPKYERDDSDQAPDDTASLVMNLVTYIAASNADIVQKPSAPRPSYGGKGQAKKLVTNWEVGFRIGPTIEKALSGIKQKEQSGGNGGGGHASPRPHIRAAHWHHYWTGPKDNRELSLRWVSQAFVNCMDAENLPVVEHHNRQKQRGYIHGI